MYACAHNGKQTLHCQIGIFQCDHYNFFNCRVELKFLKKVLISYNYDIGSNKVQNTLHFAVQVYIICYLSFSCSYFNKLTKLNMNSIMNWFIVFFQVF